jgi:hypothetical protein
MFATIYLPNFFLQAALRHQDISSSAPVGLIDETEKKPLIIQLNPAAETAGIHTGMSPSQGLARCLDLIIKTRSSAQEQALGNLILQYCFSLSPNVEATAAGLWTIQFSRTNNLCEKVSCVVHQLGQCRIAAQAGIAPTPDMSFLAANLGKPVLEIKDVENFLAPLPIDILAIPFQR